MFLFYFEAEGCIKCLVIKVTAMLFDYNIVKMTSDNRKKTLSSVTPNCQIYSMQLDTLNTVVVFFFKLKDFLNFIIDTRSNLLNN